MKQQNTKKKPKLYRTGIALLANTGFFFFTLLYLEIILRLIVFRKAGGNFLYVAGFDFVFAGILALITSFLPKKAHFTVTAVITGFLVVLFGSQIVYYYAFGTLYSVSQMQMGGAAITTFWRETISTIAENLPALAILLVPGLVLALLRKGFKKIFRPSQLVWRATLVGVAVVMQILCVSVLKLTDTGFYSNYYFYRNSSTTADQAASRFGLLTAFRLGAFSFGGEYAEEDNSYAPATSEATVPETSVTTEPQPTQKETVPPTEPEKEYGYNVFSIDFDALNGLTTNKKHKALNDYCKSITGTRKNKYTGMLSGYNLIYICGESFSTAAIHPEVTPTLYKMAAVEKHSPQM